MPAALMLHAANMITAERLEAVEPPPPGWQHARPMPESPDRERLFPKLDEAQIARLAQRGRRRPVRKGEVLWEVGAAKMGFYVILSGKVEVVRPLPGREESLTVHGPGE